MSVYKSKKITADGRAYFFRIKYRDIEGVSHDYSSKKFKTKKEAEMEEALYRIDVGKSMTNVNVTIRQGYYELRSQMKRSCKEVTILKLDGRFKYMNSIADCKINELSLGVYRKFISYLEGTSLGIDSKNKILSLFKRIITFCNKCYGSSDSVIKYVEYFKDKSIKKEMQFFTYDEYLKFESVIDDFMYKSFFRVLFYQGLRVGECMALTWNDINFDSKEMHICKTLTGKIKGIDYVVTSPKTQSSNRDIPMNKYVIDSLKEMYDYYSSFNDFSSSWFVFGGSVPFNETTICVHKNKYCAKASVKQIRIHDFRHSCASFLITHGATISLVSKWLGHSKISITLDTYTHMYKSELNSIVNLVNNL